MPPDPLDLPDALSAYLDAWESGALGRDLSLAEQLGSQLDALGERTEVIYAEVAVAPNETAPLSAAQIASREQQMAWLSSRAAGVPPVPASFVRLGFDVSPPDPGFHSAIFQPGLVRHDAGFVTRLNSSGLIDDQAVAASLMHQANATGYRLSTFCVLGIWARNVARGI
jgi:hypothetical protein